MRWSAAFGVVLAVTLVGFAELSAAADSDRDISLCSARSGCRSLWTTDAGAMILHRSEARPAILVEDGTTGAELANVSDFELGVAGGPRLGISRQLGCGWEAGLGYFGVNQWSASRSLDDPGNLRVPMVSSDPADFFDTAGACYNSELHSAEIYVAREILPQVKLSGAFRWVQLNESISAEAYSPDLEGWLSARTQNDLYGFQLGADAVLWQGEVPLSIEGFLKAGIYRTHTNLAMEGEGTYFSMAGSTGTTRTSFVGELGLLARYRFTDWLSAYAGYEVLWIDGVGLAGDFPAAMNSWDENVLRNGSPFYHGALVGAEVRW